MKERYYRPELDALRFFAFATVFLHHSPLHSASLHTIHQDPGLSGSLFPHSLSGVPARHTLNPFPSLRSLLHAVNFGAIHDACGFGLCIFFLLSSYLIVTILLREKDKTGTVSLTSFAARRVLRIWPLYFLILAIAFIIGQFCTNVAISGHALLAFSILLGNLYILKHGWVLETINPLWSLSVEEQFYLAIPGLTRAGGRRALTIVCWLTLALSYAVLIWLGHRQSIAIVGVWANSFVQFQFFAAGSLIALTFSQRKLRLSNPLRLVIALLGFILWYIASSRYRILQFSPSSAGELVPGYLLLLTGTVAIFLAVLDSDVKVPKAFLYLGKISYGLYLFHQLFLWLVFSTGSSWPPFLFLSNHLAIGEVVALSATLAAASLSYHFFERPILVFKTRFETIKTRTA
jgi:peptidoglycan/LPS O-acetylase OafA/YrhL